MLAFVYFAYQMMSLVSLVVQHKHGIRTIVKLLQEPNSRQDMLAFIYFAYQMMSLLLETRQEYAVALHVIGRRSSMKERSIRYVLAWQDTGIRMRPRHLAGIPASASCRSCGLI
jgi:hypothetical protein